MLTLKNSLEVLSVQCSTTFAIGIFVSHYLLKNKMGTEEHPHPFSLDHKSPATRQTHLSFSTTKATCNGFYIQKRILLTLNVLSYPERTVLEIGFASFTKAFSRRVLCQIEKYHIYL
ncbi:hypothetical protein CEXT_533061 [Caerostris extrusa]|uniref:Uncharacterized protein n=1 Tax=Caerostris extrusa TaxID=172846 RepID=A0AAV4Y3B3_CAEEX|nr:hypothetical protein CEXT_533061 [Caerostris extrusa]